MKQLFYFLMLAFIVTACSKDDGLESFQGNDLSGTGEGTSGSITRFTTFGDYLYALDQNQVLTYDISAKNEPVLVSKLKTDYGLETIIIYDATIFVGSRNALYILDIANPAYPSVISKSERDDLNLTGGCDPVVVKENHAFATVKIIENVCGQTSMQSQLLVYDITDKINPELLVTVAMDIPNGLGYRGDYLFVCDEGRNEIVIFDISSPGNIFEFDAIPLDAPIDIIIREDRMIVSTKNNFTIYDISDIQNIREVAFIPLT